MKTWNDCWMGAGSEEKLEVIDVMRTRGILRRRMGGYRRLEWDDCDQTMR